MFKIFTILAFIFLISLSYSEISHENEEKDIQILFEPEELENKSPSLELINEITETSSSLELDENEIENEDTDRVDEEYIRLF